MLPKSLGFSSLTLSVLLLFCCDVTAVVCWSQAVGRPCPFRKLALGFSLDCGGIVKLESGCLNCSTMGKYWKCNIFDFFNFTDVATKVNLCKNHTWKWFFIILNVKYLNQISFHYSSHRRGSGPKAQTRGVDSFKKNTHSNYRSSYPCKIGTPKN